MSQTDAASRFVIRIHLLLFESKRSLLMKNGRPPGDAGNGGLALETRSPLTNGAPSMMRFSGNTTRSKVRGSAQQ